MRIVALSENTATTDKLFPSHGLSLYIEHNDKTILFGTGGNGRFAENAARLSVPVFDAEAVVLSHNHTSCTGGLEAFMKRNSTARFFIRKSAAADCYEKKGMLKKSTGLSASFFRNNASRFVLYRNFSEVCEDFYLVSNEEEQANRCDSKHYIKRNGRIRRDGWSGESFAVCFPGDRKDGCVILTACSHCGIMNIINTVKKLWDCPVISVVGGLDLMGSGVNKLNRPAEAVSKLAGELKAAGIGTVYACHCTGRRGYELLKEIMGDQVQYLHTGEELEF